MTNIQHPNIIKYLDFSINPQFIITKYYNKGNLQRLLINKRRFEEKEALRIAEGILSAIKYSHSKNISHKNLKNSKIYIDDDKNPIISGFVISEKEIKKKILD